MIVQQQPADRATLRKLNPVTSGHTAVVYVTKRGDYVLGAGRLTAGEILFSSPRELYTVDVAPHTHAFALALPSQEQAFSFAADVRVTWQVTDPVAAVKVRLEDPTRQIEQHVEEKLREHARGFEVERAVEAERQINLDFDDRLITVSDAVVVKRCKVVLTLDELTRTHIASRTLHLRERETHTFAIVRQEEQHVLEMSAEQHQLALKSKRMNVYAKALREDDQNVLALMLAGHGEDASAVINLMMQQKQLQYDAAKEMLDRLLAANLVNRKDVAAIMSNAGTAIVSGVKGSPPPMLPAQTSDRDYEDEEEE